MTFLTEEAIATAAKKLHVDITGINAISTLAQSFYDYRRLLLTQE